MVPGPRALAARAACGLKALANPLANRGLLAAAWFIVIVATVAGLLFALTLPPPPPSAEPVVVAIDLPEPPEAGEATDGPPAEAADGDAAPSDEAVIVALPPAQSPAAEGEAQSEPADAGTAEEMATEEMVAEAPHQEAAEAAPEQGGEPQPKVSAKLPAAPAEPTTEVTAALPEPKPETPTAQDHASAGQAPADHGGGDEAAAADHGSEAAAPAQKQVVKIPVIPPAPEQLAYWERYRQPFNMADPRPRIAVVLSGLGLSDSATELAINKLPPAITLSFSPYARGLEQWIALARARGHEVMLDLPMEPSTFPNEDPGPQGLLTGLSEEDNLDRLDWVLSRGSAYVGVAGAMGSRFTTSRRAMEPILREVKNRGLIFLDRRTAEQSLVPQIAREIGLVSAINNRSVDERQASRVAIDARLAQIERIALSEGFAVAMAQPYPVTLERLAEWATELTGRGFVIAPISALADHQQIP